MSLPTLALPGQLLGSSSKYVSGPGTYLHASNIYASLSGQPAATTPTSKSHLNKPTLTITRLSSSSATASLGPVSERINNTNALPKVGDVVLGRVTRCTMKQVNVGIVVVVGAEGKEELRVEGTVCAHEIQGVVRREDVRATEKEKVDVGEGFRVGDVIRAVVVGFKAFPMPAMRTKVRYFTQISLGDQSNYYLTTAKNELGVILAKSENGNTMYPINWKDFMDPVTGETETRKVAKPL
ncbi:MAG: hypothetical protein Q9183_001765 [Haloplaca sp. 2 TL-2023]